MKKLLFAFCFVFGAAVAVNAQDGTATANQTPETEVQDQDKEAIAITELPANVQSSLEGQDYSGWTVSNAFKKEKDGKTFYAVELKNGADTKKVKFDADGNKIKEKDKDEAQ